MTGKPVQKTRMIRNLVFSGLALAAVGCTSVELARLAPPGIIRYERIADEKEPNPEIVARIEERRVNEQARFPKIGETAAGGAKRQRIPNQAVPGQIEQLETEKANLDMALETARLESIAAAQEADAMNEAAADLSSAVDKAKSDAARDRAQGPEIDQDNEK